MKGWGSGGVTGGRGVATGRRGGACGRARSTRGGACAGRGLPGVCLIWVGWGERGAWLGKMGVSSDPTPVSSRCRNDEKTAADYKIQGGSVLHLVLALRGGGAGR